MENALYSDLKDIYQNLKDGGGLNDIIIQILFKLNEYQNEILILRDNIEHLRGEIDILNN